MHDMMNILCCLGGECYCCCQVRIRFMHCLLLALSVMHFHFQYCNYTLVYSRPPGHHAECNAAMGFCFFNNVAMAAKMAVEKHGLKR